MEDFRIVIREPLGASFSTTGKKQTNSKERAPSGINFSEGAL
jgi:hypothetical protein